MNVDEAKACVGPGWSGLIDRFYQWVAYLSDSSAVRDIAVMQAENRMGMLRMHATSSCPVTQDMLHRLAWSLERNSAIVCEVCGKKGFRRKALLGSPNRCTLHYLELANAQGA